jgi:hypothetical protein
MRTVTLDVVVKLPEPVLVGFFRGVCSIVGVLRLEARLIPAIPRADRVIGGRERFLFANSSDPSIHRFLVCRLQAI